MSKADLTNTIKTLEKEIQWHRYVSAYRTSIMFLDVDFIMKENNIPEEHRSLVSSFQSSIISMQNPEKGIVWDDSEKVMVFDKGNSTNFSEAQKVTRKFNKEVLEKIGRAKNELAETGHLYNANIIEASYDILNPQRAPEQFLPQARKRGFRAGSDSTLHEDLARGIYAPAKRRYDNKVKAYLQKLDVNITLDKIIEIGRNKANAKYTVGLFLQSKQSNQKDFKAWEAKFKQRVIAGLKEKRAYLDKIKWEAARGSPSYKELLADSIVEVAKTGKTKTRRVKGGSSQKTKLSKLAKVKSESTVVKLPRLRSATGRFTNILKLKALLNTLLHDQVQANMGKGGSKQTLNYRTGRFAKSAEVSNIVQTRQDRLDIYYTWQHDPYDVFLPGSGSPLALPGRDPRRIIGRSIRQLAAKTLQSSIKFNPIPDNRS